jgi:hypothetical protein
MRIAVSPYHLTTREPAAVTAFLLGSSVVTMLPAPSDGCERERVERVAAMVPKYLDFMESWRWTIPLWRAGVIGAEWAGDVAAHEVRAVCNMIAGDERFTPLRRLMRPEVFETDERYLDAMAADLLKGGPDPSFTVPVAAGMDRFATRHGLAVVRSEPTSIVQRAEERLGERIFALAMPVLLQATAERFLLARELLEPQLAEIRAAMTQLADIVEAGESNGHSAELRERLAAAARDYAREFESCREQLMEPPTGDDEDDVRMIDGVVTITGMFLPADAALTSSLAAMRTISPGLGRLPAGARGSNLPAPLAETRRVFTLLVKVMGRPRSR